MSFELQIQSPFPLRSPPAPSSTAHVHDGISNSQNSTPPPPPLRAVTKVVSLPNTVPPHTQRHLVKRLRQRQNCKRPDSGESPPLPAPPPSAFAWSAKTRRAPSRLGRATRVFGVNTTVMHDLSTHPLLRLERDAWSTVK